MKKLKQLLILIYLVNVLFLCFAAPCHAATGFNGFAIFRDGAFLGTTWHAGLMRVENPVVTSPVFIGGIL